MKMTIMPMKADIRLNDEGELRLRHRTTSSDSPFCIASEMYTAGKVYETVALTHKVYDGGESTPVYLLFDDTGVMRQTSLEFWEKVEGKKIDS